MMDIKEGSLKKKKQFCARLSKAFEMPSATINKSFNQMPKRASQREERTEKDHQSSVPYKETILDIKEMNSF